MTLEAYAKVRKADQRARSSRTASCARVRLGEHMTLQFEDEMTIRYQIQEMLRIEKIFEEAGIQDEIEAYEPLVPDGSNWKATMLIEYPDVDERQRELARLIGVEDRVFVEVEGTPRVYAIADEDLDRENEREDLGRALPALRAHAADDRSGVQERRATLAIGVDHPAYQAEIPSLGEPARARRCRRTSLKAQSRKFSYCSGKSVIDFRISAIAACRSSLLAPETRTASPWIDRLHLELAVLQQLDDLLRELLLDAGAHRHRLLHLVAGDLLDIAVRRASGCRRRAWSACRSGCR